jgi:predicted flap endonuclease-1-like 5' DNA nuclease
MIFTPNMLVVIGLALLIGLVLGLMMSGRGKYKTLWRQERHERERIENDRDVRVKAANDRIAELESSSRPIGPGTATAVAGAAKGRDDLSRIRGISRDDEVRLNEAGCHRFSQIAGLSAEQEAALEARLGLEPGRIAKENWREQAKLLKAGKTEEHQRIYVSREAV